MNATLLKSMIVFTFGDVPPQPPKLLNVAKLEVANATINEFVQQSNAPPECSLTHYTSWHMGVSTEVN